MAVLFFVLTPGVLLRLPVGGSKLQVAATHAVVFALVYHVIHKMALYGYEGFANASPASKSMEMAMKDAMPKH